MSGTLDFRTLVANPKKKREPAHEIVGQVR